MLTRDHVILISCWCSDDRCQGCDDDRRTDVTAGEIAAAIDRESAALDATWAQWAERGAL